MLHTKIWYLASALFCIVQFNFTFFRIWTAAYQNVRKGSRESVSFICFSDLDLGIASSVINDISQALFLAHVNINVYAKCYQNIQKVPRDRASFTVFFFFCFCFFFSSEFEARQHLGQSQMTFINHLGYILSISMCMRNFITIVHSVRPFSLFQNLELGIASTHVRCHFPISWVRFDNPSV